MNNTQQKILPAIIISLMIGIIGVFVFIFGSKSVGIGFIFVAGLIATVVSISEMFLNNENGCKIFDAQEYPWVMTIRTDCYFGRKNYGGCALQLTAPLL